MNSPPPTHDILVQTLASGSSGNATLVRCGPCRLLLDAGISTRRLERAMAAVDEDIGQLSAVLVTHEHRDHTAALPVFNRRYPHIPIFASRGTGDACRRLFGWDLPWSRIHSGRRFEIAGARVLPFPLRHDAAEPVGFRVDLPGLSLGLATDMGTPTPAVVEALGACRVLLVEANYDVDMLRTGKYPPHLKARVSSQYGHLSNHQARRLVESLASPVLEEVFLIHLSDGNNQPELALKSVRQGLASYPHVHLSAAPRHEAGRLCRLPPLRTPEGQPHDAPARLEQGRLDLD